MKILYIAPNINHHQVPFIKELIKIVGEGNVLYATPMVIEKTRLQMGFNVYLESWLLNIMEDKERMLIEIDKADVVLCSIRDYYPLLLERLKKQKLTFYFSERWFKPPLGILRLLHPCILRLVYKFYRMSRYEMFYYLPQGYFAETDFRMMGLCRNRMLQFGYFTPSEKTTEVISISLPQNKINLLWCGRLLKLKRVDLLIRAYAILCQKYDNIHLTIVGEGSEKTYLVKLLEKYVNNDRYTMFGFLDNKVIRNLMSQADIYVLPSNGYEGWGAVINEAMNEKCVVVAADKIGAAKSMINDGVNGCFFTSGNYKSLAIVISKLLDNINWMSTIKENAYHTIMEEWSAKVAAERFIKVCTAILENRECPLYISGPISLYK